MSLRGVRGAAKGAGPGDAPRMLVRGEKPAFGASGRGGRVTSRPSGSGKDSQMRHSPQTCSTPHGSSGVPRVRETCFATRCMETWECRGDSARSAQLGLERVLDQFCIIWHSSDNPSQVYE